MPVTPKLTDESVVRRAQDLTKRQSAEWADLVYEAVIGRSIGQVAELLGRDSHWVRERLDEYAMLEAAGGDIRPPEGGEGPSRSTIGSHAQRREIVKKFAPAEPCEEYVEEYEAKGHEPAVAKRLAKAYQAAETAIDKGVIRESRSAEKEKFFEVALPKAAEWGLTLNRICSNIRSAAGALDGAKINDLKRKETFSRVTEAFKELEEQMERVNNFHSNHSEV